MKLVVNNSDKNLELYHISTMDAKELLMYILSNPHFLTNPEYLSYHTAIYRRARELV